MTNLEYNIHESGLPEKALVEHFDLGRLNLWLNFEGSEDVRRIKHKMLANVRYVDGCELRDKIDKLAGNYQPEGRYAVIYDNRFGKSKYWAYTNAKGLLKSQPELGIYTYPDDDCMNLERLATNNINDFVIFDDCAYSGRQIYQAMLYVLLLQAQRGSDRASFTLNVPFMTGFSKRRFLGLTSEYTNLASRIDVLIPENIDTIPSIRDILTEEEREILKRVHPIYGDDIYLNTTLTYFEHKVADGQSFEPTLKECMVMEMNRNATVYSHASQVEAERIAFEESVWT